MKVIKKPALLLTVFAVFTTGIASGNGYKCMYAPGRVLVKFKAGVTKTGNQDLKLLKASSGCTAVKAIFNSGLKDRFAGNKYGLDRIFSFDCSLNDVDKLIKLFNKSGLFEYVEPDYEMTSCAEKVFMPNDRYFYRQWALNNDATFNMSGMIHPKADADIDMPEAWEIEQGDSTVIIAILDSGCKMNHPELAGHFWKNPGEIPGNGIDDDNDGFIDDLNGWNFVNNDNNLNDDEGHGTGLAGVIGAIANNSIGFAGVNFNAKIMIIKVTDSKRVSTTANVVKGIQYAVNRGARIINMSYVSKTPSETEKTAIMAACDAGVILVGAAGNKNDSSVYYPADYEHVISVGATGPDDKRWVDSSTSGSNYGAGLDLVAPGSYIFLLDTTSVDSYNSYGTGTSLSAAFVTGVASLLLSRNPSLTPDQVCTILTESADDQVGDPNEDTPGWDKYYGAGRLNAYKALQRVVSVKNNPVKKHLNISRTRYLLNLGDFTTNKLNGEEVYTLSGRRLHQLEGNASKSVLPGGLFIIKHEMD